MFFRILMSKLWVIVFSNKFRHFTQILELHPLSTFCIVYPLKPFNQIYKKEALKARLSVLISPLPR